MNEPTLLGKKKAEGLVPGSRLGRYEIVKRIATGGMAELFLARTVGLMSVQQVVVIKRILPQLASQNEFVEMFLDEARIAATLQHPNIVQMHDVGEENGNYYIAMEYLHGEDARSIMVATLKQQRRLPMPVALHMVVGVAAALQYAHEKVDFDGKPLKIVHRDVTPQNIVATFDGNIKLVDFGIAKASNRLNETRFGTLKGKVAYMSPEQCTGQPLDRRSDIFSLGIVLFELTLSRRLFRGKSDFEILKSIVEEPIPRPTAIDAQYPPELERIVLKALTRDAAGRYQTARELQIDLEEFARKNLIALGATTTSEFVSEIFGRKLEAWREASTKGKSLMQILEEQPEVTLDEDEVVELSPEDQSAVRRAHAGRAALLEEIERKKRAMEPLDEEELAALDTTAPVDKIPRRSLGLAIGIPFLASLLLVSVYLWRLPHPSQATKPSPPPASEAPAPVAAAPPVPVVEAKNPSERAEPAEPAEPKPPAEPPPAEPAAEAVAEAAAKPKPTTAKQERMPARRIAKGREKQRPPSAEPAAGGVGKLMIASKPWVNVTIDGKSYGQTPLGVELPAGTHTMLVTNPEFSIKRTISISIKGGEILRKKLDF